ncbi:Signal transducer regulating beta-lactamase production, contains metallopeptidase domain [Algoriphagus locisalis]|uniref:Signal transducer regulating beta-lactamase production, contains metallopeptidase domain n=1 Tax=Algoriphagus locisalis TaxID=305507 RepID=A0A1I6YRT2_9BACT|nr:M56 family metallopeptidase [Algoriphagus locisalis]SFT53143.1 Signal transducer regulating beta-lactamase production, contains metallopeptidase domain [Algoriphagus locisalis]
MIVYLLKFILCSAALFTLFKLFLSREKSFQFNRIALLLIIPLAAIAPLLSVPIEIQYPIEPVETSFFQEQMLGPISSSQISEPFTPTKETTNINWIFLTYLLIALLLLVFKSHSIVTLMRWKNQGEKLTIDGATIIISEKAKTPFSFLNTIFIKKIDYEKGNELGVIVSHEMAHISQRHYLDLFILEFLNIIFWFNPICYLIKYQAQVNHEYLADQIILERNYDVNQYKKTLFKFSTSNLIPLTSPIVSSTLKLRITMLNKSQNKHSKNWSILASCILGILTWGAFTLDLQAQEVKAIPVKTLNQVTQSSDQLSKAAQELDKLIEDATVIKTNSKGEEVRQFWNREGLQLQIYNLYQQLPDDEKTGDRKRHGEMAILLTKTPDKKTVTSDQLQLWVDDTQYGVWIDGKRIENSVLLRMKAEDFASFHNSRLMKNAINYGDHYFQINLMTHDYFDKTYPLLKIDK